MFSFLLMHHTRLAGTSNTRKQITKLCFSDASPLEIEKEKCGFTGRMIALTHNLTIGPGFGTVFEFVCRSVSQSESQEFCQCVGQAVRQWGQSFIMWVCQHVGRSASDEDTLLCSVSVC